MRTLGLFGLILSGFFLVIVLPIAVFSGEFVKDLELALPGLVFWLSVYFASRYALRRAARSSRQKEASVADRDPPNEPPADG